MHGYYSQSQQLLDRARAALAAEPAGEGPSEQEIDAFIHQWWEAFGRGYLPNSSDNALVTAALARWGRPTALVQPEVGSMGAPSIRSALWRLLQHIEDPNYSTFAHGYTIAAVRAFMATIDDLLAAISAAYSAHGWVASEEFIRLFEEVARLAGIVEDGWDASVSPDDTKAKARAALAQPEHAGGSINDEQREAVRAAVTEALGGAYDCIRVWEAWQVGTMGPDDFVLVAEDDDRVAEIADAAIEAMRPATPPAPEAGEVGLLVDRLNQVAGDFDFLCNKIVNGECRALTCLRRGGYDDDLCRARGIKPPDPSVATCPALEQAGAVRRAATLLQQLSAPAPVVVPVAVSERPWEREGWCNEKGKCWLQSKIEGDWRLFNPLNSGLPQLRYCFSYSLPFHAIPLPQTGEVEA
jgi:hypothetical protein